MSLSVVQEALSILDTIANLPTGPITFTNAVFTIFTVISVILSTDGLEGWHKQVNQSLQKEVLSAKDEKLLAPITQLLLHIKQAKLHEHLNFMKGGGEDTKDKKDNPIECRNAGQYFSSDDFELLPFANKRTRRMAKRNNISL